MTSMYLQYFPYFNKQLYLFQYEIYFYWKLNYSNRQMWIILFLYKSVFVRVGLSSNKWTHGLMLDFGDFYDNSRLNKILAKIQKMDL